MSENFVDIAHVEINGVEMQTIKSISVDISDPKNPMKTMNRRRRALGVTRGVPDYSIKITAAIQEADPEIDWHAWKQNKEARLLVYEQNDDGKRVQLIDVFINSISEKYDEGGESTYDIDAIALDRRED